jgi:hypothetical protein
MALLLGFALLALALRAPDVWRPIDGTTWQPWRETDVGAIARNFLREDMNILHPRIDWRGDGPGLVEMEFPIYPWTVALVYRAFGYAEPLARVVSLVLSLLTCAAFFCLARRLPGPPARSCRWSCSPPTRSPCRWERDPAWPAMPCYTAGVLFCLRWLDVAATTSLAAACIALAILVGFCCLHRPADRRCGLDPSALARCAGPAVLLAAIMSCPRRSGHAFSRGLARVRQLTGISNEAYAGSRPNFLRRLPRLRLIACRSRADAAGRAARAGGSPGRRGPAGRVLGYWLGALAGSTS